MTGKQLPEQNEWLNIPKIEGLKARQTALIKINLTFIPHARLMQYNQNNAYKKSQCACDLNTF
jgi:hypothetical protein